MLSVQVEAALLYDAVHVFAKAVHTLESSRQTISVSHLRCDSVGTWTHGYSLVNYMKLVSKKRSWGGGGKESLFLRENDSKAFIWLRKKN